MFIYNNDIIPKSQVRTGVKDELDLESICVFIALGFFLGDKTYYKGLKQHLPACETVTDEKGHILQARPTFSWHYSPRDISFKKALDEFTELFETIISEGAGEHYTIPISGGLDSRTLVAACQHLKLPYQGYSYEFRNGIKETRFGELMSDKLGFPYTTYIVEPGSLWSYIDRIAEKNECYSEFTHGRQFACYDQLSQLGGTFLLGHGGDLFFDSMGVPDQMDEAKLFNEIWKRLVKPSGFELAQALWAEWGLKGKCTDRLASDLQRALRVIKIDEANPRLRAFKTMYYVSRWTCVNLQIFKDFGDNVIPYFDDRICQFICTVPEKWLKGRKIQIEYLKLRSPKLASIVWQDHRPFNLYTYGLDRSPLNYPYRAYRKVLRKITRVDTVRRNWEIQFMGSSNQNSLTQHILGSNGLSDLIPNKVSEGFLSKFFTQDPVKYYHSTTMMATLASFTKMNKHESACLESTSDVR